MKTRFDHNELWIDGCGKANHVKDMPTMHLLNVLAHFIKKPSGVMDMLVRDIESGDFDTSSVWTAGKGTADTMAQSIANVTALSADELTTYALCSDLGMAISDELIKRGVNVENALSVLTGKRSMEGNDAQ